MPTRAFALAFIAALGLSAACGGGTPEEGLPDRETFVATWTDLRLAGLQRPGLPITATDRTRILEAHGVTEEGMLRFAEVYGARPDEMQQIMIEIRTRVDQQRNQTDPG
jgi:hypothetical protein